MNDLSSKLLDISREAAAVIREVYETQFSVEYKAPRDPVTAADKRANELICRRLRAEFPGVPIVAEESDPESFEGYRNAERVFYVDPLDGTKEFIARNGEFVVMIGMIDGDRATAGIVHAPAKNVAWVGVVGEGAFRIPDEGEPEPIRVSETTELSKASIVASRSHRSEDLQRALDLMGVERVITMGSAGLKGSEIATGGADLYVATGRSGKRWDSCATDAIVTAAGGRYSDAFGVPFDYRSVDLSNVRGIVASNGTLHDAVMTELASSTAERSTGR